MTSSSVRSLSLVAALLVASAGSSFAQTPQPMYQSSQDCPVQLTQLRIHANKLIFRDRNNSDRYIKKIAFGAAYFDGADVPHRIEVQGGWKDLHSGFTLDSALDIRNYRKTGYTGWVIWPEKVLYRNGTLWQINADDEHCGLQTRNTVTEDVPYVPPQLIDESPTVSER